MPYVRSKSFLSCNKSTKVLPYDNEPKANHFGDGTRYKSGKTFRVMYCSNCNEAWEPAHSGLGIQHYPDFPMQRKLEHKTCPECARELKRTKVEEMLS